MDNLERLNQSFSASPVPPRIVSGGQTGVDRAALDVALSLGLPCGGWCPQGRLAEDGVIPESYPLVETPCADYAQRTHWNVRDADGTLILVGGPFGGGTAYTLETARNLGKPHLIVDLDQNPLPQAVHTWLHLSRIQTLNTAGPRESQSSGIYALSARFLQTVFADLGSD